MPVSLGSVSRWRRYRSTPTPLNPIFPPVVFGGESITVNRGAKYGINILTRMMTKQVRVRNKKGITLLSDLGTFILNNKITDLLSYELSMPVRFDSNVRPFCFYHKDDFNVLQEEERKRICSHHLNNLIVSQQ